MTQGKIVSLSIAVGGLGAAVMMFGAIGLHIANQRVSGWSVASECKEDQICPPQAGYTGTLDIVPDKIGLPMNTAPLFSHYLEDTDDPGWKGNLALVVDLLFWIAWSFVALEIVHSFVATRKVVLEMPN